MGHSTEPNSTSEIHKIEVHQLDAKTSHRFTNYRSKNPGGGARGEIRELSRQSRSRLIYKARNLQGLNMMVTFTYPHADYAENATGGDFMQDGRAVKEHLRKLRQLLTYRKCYGFWFLEFQKRGAPHVHFILSGNLSLRDEANIKRTWARMVGSTCPHHPKHGCKFEVLRKKHAAGAYAAKYSSKDEQKQVPTRYRGVGRFWGLFGKEPNQITPTVTTSLRELYRIARIARGWQKAERREWKSRRRRRSHGQGFQGTNLYGCGPIIRAYLARNYTVPENPSEILLRSHARHSAASECPLLAGTSAAYERTCAPLRKQDRLVNLLSNLPA